MCCFHFFMQYQWWGKVNSWLSLVRVNVDQQGELCVKCSLTLTFFIYKYQRYHQGVLHWLISTLSLLATLAVMWASSIDPNFRSRKFDLTSSSWNWQVRIFHQLHLCIAALNNSLKGCLLLSTPDLKFNITCEPQLGPQSGLDQVFLLSNL